MSSIEKLQISGIRSFGPEAKDVATIKFCAPLTLILGQNGCGKTTIIEALKYGICGELPGGTDGGSGFIHDPKLCSRVESRGSVKLQCQNVKGKEVTVSRHVQVTQRTKKLEFKSLDATVTNEKKKSISGRCADIDAYMCSELGVSKAVLTNVIFCHQEDSSWPLEKGKKMKERFDAIFGIAEFNKCMDHLRQIVKDMNMEEKIIKKEVECNELLWEEASMKRTKLDEDKAKLAATRDGITSFNKQMEPIQTKYEELLRKEENLGVHVAKVSEKKNKKQQLKEAQQELKNSIKTEFFGSKEELFAKIENFQQELKDKQKELKEIIEEKNMLIQEEKAILKSIGVKTLHLGNYQAEEDINNRYIDSRNAEINNLAVNLELPILSSTQLNENNGEESLRNVERKLKKMSKELENVQEQNDSTEKRLQNTIDSHKEKKISLEQVVKLKKRQIEENDTEIINVNKEIEQVDKSAKTLGQLEKELSKVNKELEEAVNYLNVNNLKAKISDNIEKRGRLEDQLSTIEDEIRSLQKYSLEKSNLDKLVERKNNLEEKFKTTKEKISSSLRHLLSEVPEKDFRKKLEAKMDEITNQIKSLQTSVSQKQTNLASVEARKNGLDEQLRNKQRKLSEDEDQVYESVGKENVDEYIESLKNKLQTAQNSKGTLNSSEILFQRYVEKLESTDPLCPLCKRGFNAPEEIQELTNDLKRRLREIPSKLRKHNSDIEELQQQQTQVIQLKPLCNSISTARDVEIPRLKKNIEELVGKINTLKTDIETEQNQLLEPQTDFEVAKSIQSDAMLLDQLQKDLSSLSQEVTIQEKKIPTIGVSKTLDEANMEQACLKAELSALRNSLETDQNSLSAHNEKLSRLRDRVNNITSQQMKLEGGVQQRKSLTEKLEKLKSSAMTLHNELNNANEKLSPIAAELNNVVQELSRKKAEHKYLMEEKKKKLNDYNNKIGTIKSYQKDIDKYTEKGGHSRIQSCREELKELNMQKDGINNRKTRVEKTIEEINQTQNRQELAKLDLDNNLKLRQKKEEMIKVEQEIIELEGQLGTLSADNLSAEKKLLGQKLGDLQRKKAQSEGRLIELQDQVRRMDIDLNREQYKTAEEKYKKSVISLKVHSLSAKDIKKYEAAMDSMMMSLHHQRMQLINQIIRELWRQTYCGNDIDTIEIKAEEGTQTAGGRKNYNYRVIQIKNGIELDMPGRCSAGQKVLACLIIRMALAETFCKNCGIIALDEPTTNLDHDNIESLSNTLKDIVNKRYAQKNFQLLVITHDEEFLKRLSRVDKVEHYLEVRRNDRGKSEVRTVKF